MKSASKVSSITPNDEKCNNSNCTCVNCNCGDNCSCSDCR